MAGKTKLVTVTGLEVVEDESATAGSEPLNIDVGGTGALTARGAAAALLIPYILQKSSVPVSSSNDTNETAFATVSIAAGAQGSNGILRVTTHWACTSNTNAKTLRVRYDGIAGQAFLTANATSTTSVSAATIIGQNNSTFSQVGAATAIYGSGEVKGSATAATAAANTSAATSLVITGQKGTGTDTLTLNSYLVELLYGA
jgi:hypothetical protein